MKRLLIPAIALCLVQLGCEPPFVSLLVRNWSAKETPPPMSRLLMPSGSAGISTFYDVDSLNRRIAAHRIHEVLIYTTAGAKISTDSAFCTNDSLLFRLEDPLLARLPLDSVSQLIIYDHSLPVRVLAAPAIMGGAFAAFATIPYLFTPSEHATFTSVPVAGLLGAVIGELLVGTDEGETVLIAREQGSISR